MKIKTILKIILEYSKPSIYVVIPLLFGSSLIIYFSDFINKTPLDKFVLYYLLYFYFSIVLMNILVFRSYLIMEVLRKNED